MDNLNGPIYAALIRGSVENLEHYEVYVWTSQMHKVMEVSRDADKILARAATVTGVRGVAVDISPLIREGVINLSQIHSLDEKM